MDNIIRGAVLPERVTIYSRFPEQISTGWLDSLDTNLHEESVRKAFSVPSNDEKKNETARNWANEDRWENGKSTKYEPHSIDEEDNSPKDTYCLVGLEHRSDGGRAYKVVDEKGRCFDLREDVLFDILQNGGISNRIIRVPLIWCGISGQMKLVRYESPLYNAVKLSVARLSIKSYGMKDLIPGHIYEWKNGTMRIYLGKCS